MWMPLTNSYTCGTNFVRNIFTFLLAVVTTSPSPLPVYLRQCGSAIYSYYLRAKLIEASAFEDDEDAQPEVCLLSLIKPLGPK